MNQHDALLAAVCAAPDDDLPRLVYADWCDENGDPDRAEFIRTQIEIAKGATGGRLGALQLREKELLEEHESKWSFDLYQVFGDDFAYLFTPPQFSRGFMEDISIESWLLMGYIEALFRIAPIRTLRIDNSDVEDLLDCEHLLRITTLDLTGCALDEECTNTAKFFSSRFLGNLTTLIAQGPANRHLDVGGLRAIVNSKYLAKLRRLDIGENWLFRIPAIEHEEMTRLLIALGNLPSLTDLGLGGNWLLDPVIQRLASQPWMSRITRLGLHRNHAGDVGGRALAESPHLEQIEHLDLLDNDGFDPEVGSAPMSDEVKQLLKRRFGKRVLL